MIFLLILLLLALVFGGGFYAYRIAFYNPPADPDKAPNMDGSVAPTPYSTPHSHGWAQIF